MESCQKLLAKTSVFISELGLLLTADRLLWRILISCKLLDQSYQRNKIILM